jgi:hypothetical protein
MLYLLRIKSELSLFIVNLRVDYLFFSKNSCGFFSFVINYGYQSINHRRHFRQRV